MSKKVQMIVKVFSDKDRKSFTPPFEWFEERMEMFKQTTLRSLERQTTTDFIIMLVHGQRYKARTSKWLWEDSKIPIYPVYDEGRALLQSIDADYVTITRLDSDDLMHEECMAEVREKAVLSNQVEYMVWRVCYTLEKVNNYLAWHYRGAPVSTTQVFPRAVYKDWNVFRSINCVAHSRLGGRLSRALELNPKRICNVRHGQNTNHLKNGVQALRLTLRERDELLSGDFSGIENHDKDETIRFVKKKGGIITGDMSEILELLRPFGVQPWQE